MRPTPDEIPNQFSQLSNMGEPIEVFKAKTSLILHIIAAGLLFLAFCGFSAFASYQSYNLWSQNYYYQVILKAILPWLVAAGVALLLALLMLWQIYTSRKRAAIVCENGFAYSDRKGVKVWQWEQIESVTANIARNYTYGIYIGTTHTYDLVNTEGEKLEINDSLKDVDNFYAHLQNKSLQLRYRRLADLYNKGNKVSFGPVTISKQDGLQVGKKNFTWETIEQVTIDKGILSVKKKDGAWFSGATATSGSIPNLHVLLSIIHQVVGLRAGK